MQSYSGKFHYTTDPPRDGPCQFAFTAETCTLTPASGAAMAFDLGDVDIAVKNDWDMELTLFTGRHLALRQFGAAFDRMAGEFIAAWRDRTLRCLLLEDLAMAGAFRGAAAIAPEGMVAAEVRVFKSNIAVLPLASTAYQWRLAAVDAISFNAETYTVRLQSGNQRLVIGKLGKRTEEFLGTLQQQYDELRRRSAEAMHEMFPFLDPGQLEQLLMAMPEGRGTSFAKLGAIHPKLLDAILKRSVTDAHRPYFDALRAQSLEGSILAGYKFIRDDEAEDSQKEGAEEKLPLFFWFFFPLVRPLSQNDGRHSGMAAWEASTGSGRATYFFHTGQAGESPEHVEAAMAKLTEGLAVVNFRREPIYLSDESLSETPKFHRYAIGSRKLRVLRELRAAFVGRAFHSTLENWKAAFPA